MFNQIYMLHSVAAHVVGVGELALVGLDVDARYHVAYALLQPLFHHRRYFVGFGDGEAGVDLDVHVYHMGVAVVAGAQVW